MLEDKTEQGGVSEASTLLIETVQTPKKLQIKINVWS